MKKTSVALDSVGKRKTRVLEQLAFYSYKELRIILKWARKNLGEEFYQEQTLEPIIINVADEATIEKINEMRVRLEQ